MGCLDFWRQESQSPECHIEKFEGGRLSRAVHEARELQSLEGQGVPPTGRTSAMGGGGLAPSGADCQGKGLHQDRSGGWGQECHKRSGTWAVTSPL